MDFQTIPRKRKRGDDIGQNKRHNVDDTYSVNSIVNILEDSASAECLNKKSDIKSGIDCLSDDILLVLLSFLSTSDLVNVSLCNSRLYNICADKTLWNKVNFTCNGKHPPHNSILPYVHSGTTSLRFYKTLNENSIDTCFEDDFFDRLKNLSNLKMLSIENHVLKPQTLMFKSLPHITELKLERTQLIASDEGQESGFCCKFGEVLPNLQVLDVSYCQWFQPYLLLPLAKCPNLKVLKMKGCCNMRDFIPYASIAATHGYPKLESLDMRLTNVGDREIGCFNKVKSLKHIYLEKPQNVVRQSEDDESITDICTTSLGMRNWHQETDRGAMVVIYRLPSDGISNTSDHILETLVVRNYPRITDITLKHAEKCLKSLRYLDITGSSCSQEEVARFRSNRPGVTLLYHDNAIQLDVAS